MEEKKGFDLTFNLFHTNKNQIKPEIPKVSNEFTRRLSQVHNKTSPKIWSVHTDFYKDLNFWNLAYSQYRKKKTLMLDWEINWRRYEMIEGPLLKKLKWKLKKSLKIEFLVQNR